MRMLRSAAVALVLLVPASTGAGTLNFFVSGGELPVSFGLVPFSVSEDLLDESFGMLGSFSLTSGPLLDRVVDAVNSLTSYTFGAGTLAFSLTVDDAGGNPVNGTFSGTTLPFSFTVCEGCDPLSGGGLSDDFEIALGNGLFSAAVAQALGIGINTTGGAIDFGLEDIDGGPDSPVRIGFDHRGFAPLAIDTTAPVPEPGLVVLTSFGVAAFGFRRRTRG